MAAVSFRENLFRCLSFRDLRPDRGCVKSIDVAEGEDGVEAAEGERVGEGEFWHGLARRSEDDVEVNGGVDLSNAGVGGEEIFFEGEDGGERFDSSACSDGVAVE